VKIANKRGATAMGRPMLLFQVNKTGASAVEQQGNSIPGNGLAKTGGDTYLRGTRGGKVELSG